MEEIEESVKNLKELITNKEYRKNNVGVKSVKHRCYNRYGGKMHTHTYKQINIEMNIINNKSYT